MADFNTSKVDGDTVGASEWNQLASIDNFITTSGQTLATGNLNQMGIGAARYSSGGQFFTDSGTANAYVLAPVSPFKAPVSATEGYFVGMEIRFRAGNANSGASTVNVNSAGVKNLKQADGTTDLAAGDIPTTQDSVFRYDGTSFVLESGSASTTAKGIIEIATNAETIAGIDTSRAIVPSSLVAAFANSKTTNGYTYLPNGLIMQWGTDPTLKDFPSSATLTFPIAFPNAILNAQATLYGSAPDATVYVSAISTTQITLIYDETGSTQSAAGRYLVIGY